MAIKSSQTLVQEALNEIKIISPEEALKLSNNNKCNLIDIRDILENFKMMVGLKIHDIFQEVCLSFG
jgi:hypothetical protein|tara:strand:- start:1295 stop:1495 length:201 start_codon:yes stop_codon:yes gene_type:complete